MIRVIRHTGRRYLTRVYLWNTVNLGVYIHWFHTPDFGRHLHDHPWLWGASLGLSGWYDETLLDAGGREYTVRRRAGRFRRFVGSTYHTIKRLSRWPCITLFIHGPRVRDWGFWDPDTHTKVPWDTYMVSRGIISAATAAQRRRQIEE